MCVGRGGGGGLTCQLECTDTVMPANILSRYPGTFVYKPLKVWHINERQNVYGTILNCNCSRPRRIPRNDKIWLIA